MSTSSVNKNYRKVFQPGQTRESVQTTNEVVLNGNPHSIRRQNSLPRDEQQYMPERREQPARQMKN